jgi:serine/threonine protein kinase
VNEFSGQSFGRYHLIEKLGEGGMAVVYKAFDTRLECDVAVKVVRLDNLPQNSTERALKRFEREAKSVARLTHANIIKVMDYGDHEGVPYLVMEYLPSGTLKEYLHKKGKMPWRDAATLLLPIAEALAYAHSMKVLHRDVKPSNILLTQTMQPMLTDFGIAKVLDEEIPQELTGTGVAIGTPEYMAPEQVTSKATDARADEYALGIVFYEMVTGRRPFEADTPMAVLFKHASEPMPRPSSLASDLPADVENFIFKATAKDPSDRYQSMDEFAAALVKLTGVPAPAPVIKSPVFPPMPLNQTQQTIPANANEAKTPPPMPVVPVQPPVTPLVTPIPTPPVNPPAAPAVPPQNPPQRPMPQMPAMPARPKKKLSAGVVVLIIIFSFIAFLFLLLNLGIIN